MKTNVLKNYNFKVFLVISSNNIKDSKGGYMSLINISKIQIFFLTLSASVLFFYSAVAFSHSGNTNQDGCHVATFSGQYHCHKTKFDNPMSVNYCIVSNAGTFCGYSSYGSCSNAARSANISNYQCMQR